MYIQQILYIQSSNHNTKQTKQKKNKKSIHTQSKTKQATNKHILFGCIFSHIKNSVCDTPKKRIHSLYLPCKQTDSFNFP